MKLHLPISLRQSLLACLSLTVGHTLYGGSAAVASDRVLETERSLPIDFADALYSDLSGGILQLTGNAELYFYGPGAGNGRVYTLVTGVSELCDAEGNPIVLGDSNNAAALYFDTSQPGTGFWADATLQLTSDGSLQLLRHNETVKEELTVSTQKTSDANYQYYEGVIFNDISSTSDGGAICGDNIALSDNGYASFIENTAGGSYVSSVRGGAICGDNIDLSGNGFVGFTDNTAAVVHEDNGREGNFDACGGAIYGDCITLSDNREVSFQGNVVYGQFIPSPILLDSFLASYEDVYHTCVTSCGGAICGGTIELMDNEEVSFDSNVASGPLAYGGAIYGGSSSTITLSNNGSVEFSGNTASSTSYFGSGGAIYGYNVTLSNNGSVTFSGNTASSTTTHDGNGGAIFGDTITLNDNGSVEFIGNTAGITGYGNPAVGGAIYGAWASTITLSGNGSVTFSGNTASSDSYDGAGGAICGSSSSTITLSNNGSVVFEGNTASTGAYEAEAKGGAIYGEQDISLCNNGSVVFEGNTASSSGDAEGNSAPSSGGAIYGKIIELCDNDSVLFDANYVVSPNNAAMGGAITSSGGSITLNNNVSVVFSGNKAVSDGRAYGGAIDGNGAPIALINNSIVEFLGNTADDGGAVNGTITMNDNGEVAFIGNTASTSGGAIYGYKVTMNNNGSVVFDGNSAYVGGAICVSTYSTITLSNNGRVEFCGNTAANSGSPAYYNSAGGGAICGFSFSTITLSNNGSVVFEGNTASSGSSYVEGGAIYTNANLSICNNDSVLFEKNVEENSGTYCLRSIHAGGSGDVISLSAAAGMSIEFRDSIYIDSDSTFNLNADYTDAAGVVNKQQGDIIFTGKYTADHLTEVKGSAGTVGEILNSQTSEVYAVTNLHGGRLRVEDGAIYKGNGITAMADSGAGVWLRNARLEHAEVHFNRGTSFGLRGSNATLATALIFDAGSSLSFEIAAMNKQSAVLSYTGSLTFGGTITLNLVAAETQLARGQYQLLTVEDVSVVSGWSDANIVTGSGTYAYGDMEWVGNTLCFNYTGQELTVLPDSPYTAEIPEIPVEPDEPEIPVIPDTPVEPEKPAPAKLVWAGEKKAVWKVGAPGWENQKFFNNGAEVSFVNGGTVTIEGKVAPAAILVNNHKNLTFKSNKKTPGSIEGAGDLTKRGAGTLTMNDGNSRWTGDTHLYAGTIKVKGTTSLGKGDVYLKGGTLNLGAKAIANDIVQSANAVIKSGKKFTGSYTLEKGELQKGSTLNIAKTATLEGGTVNGTLSGNGTVTVTGEVKLGDKGKIKTSALTLEDGAELSTSVKGLNSKSTSLCIEEDASLVLSGKLTAASLEVDGGTLKTYASKPVAISVQKDITLTDAVLATNGKVAANKLTLNASSMSIKGAKAQSLTVKQSLTIGSGSNLSLNGKLSAGSLTLKSGATLTMSGSKPVTLKVKGALTLNSGSSIILDYDFVQGKTYKILTFGSLSGVSGVKGLHDVFGVDNENCVFENTGKAITLTVTGKWNPQTQQKAVSAATSEGVVFTSASKSAGNPVADALVQSNWGQLEASRAFVNAMANRSMAVQLGNGERAVWASAIGASSRHSSAGDHAGADTNVSGGAFGLETQVGRASLFGMALGNSWTRVSAHGFGTIEQDTTHLGLYGQTNWRSGVTADWSAAYGRSESETMGSDWSLKHLQLDGRVSYNHELNANTVLSPFAGVQYYASDSAAIGTTDTGSLQNLRAEIGVAASHRVGKFGVYGEIALHQDLVRNNPTVSMEGMRYTGMNPGRTGLNFTVGTSYELNDKWSVNASYTGEFVENANAHSANVGASYKF